jgi:hypothetical protein
LSRLAAPRISVVAVAVPHGRLHQTPLMGRPPQHSPSQSNCAAFSRRARGILVLSGGRPDTWGIAFRDRPNRPLWHLSSRWEPGRPRPVWHSSGPTDREQDTWDCSSLRFLGRQPYPGRSLGPAVCPPPHRSKRQSAAQMGLTSAGDLSFTLFQTRMNGWETSAE